MLPNFFKKLYLEIQFHQHLIATQKRKQVLIYEELNFAEYFLRKEE